jgi:hypothetical protein
MKTHQVLTRKALARAAVVGISTGFAALALACPAWADHALLDKTINVPGCPTSRLPDFQRKMQRSTVFHILHTRITGEGDIHR